MINPNDSAVQIECDMASNWEYGDFEWCASCQDETTVEEKQD